MINVIGGSGFIGSRLCDRLQKNGIDFIIFDKTISKSYPEKTKIVDVRDQDTLFEAIRGGHVIINLAAEHKDNVLPRSLYDDVNVQGAKNVCNVARNRNIKTILFTSSVAVYGFAEPNTNETGEIKYFNDYGRTKWKAENVYTEWQAEDPENRKLIIIRPTVVFGENNRGNVYNLLKQIATGNFIMIGNGNNYKSMAYVENVAAFIQHSLFTLSKGTHLFNYIDKPDINMNTLVSIVKMQLGRSGKIRFRIPCFIGLVVGYILDILAKIIKKEFSISQIRIKKFCSNTQFSSINIKIGFNAPVSLKEAIEKTVEHEFKNKDCSEELFYTE